MKFSRHILVLFIFATALASAQKATIKGVILDENNKPVPDVSITSGSLGTQSNLNGFYLIQIPSDELVKLTFSHISLKNIEVSFELKNGEVLELNPVMKTAVEQIAMVVVSS